MNKTVVFGVLIIAIAFFAMFQFVKNKEQVLTTGLQTEIDQTRNEMEATAKTTGLAQVDEVANSIIRDCTVRDRYETLLGKLNTLTNSELIEVRQLHSQCSQYFPAQKAFLVNRLETQFSHYNDLIKILSDVRSVNTEEFKQEAWSSLITKEAERSDLLRKQHQIQGSIIDALIEGDSGEIKVLLDEAKKVADSLNVISIQINSEREVLFSI